MRTRSYIRDTFEYFRRTIKNKFYALVLISFGIICFGITRDATVLMVTSAIGIPLFFARTNWIL